MVTITIKNIGPIKEVQDLELNRVNVFMGPQSSGKSTIAKIISFCTWVEKDVATSQSLEEYKKKETIFRDRLESFHKMKEYFRANSYINYKSEVVEITWKNEQCSISWVDQYAYKRSKIAYIPSERNMVILPELRKVELGHTNVRSFLFDWFDARKNISNENKLSILDFGIDYYHLEGNEEDHIKGQDNNEAFDILLPNASSGLQSIIPLMVMVEYLSKWIYSEEKTSFDQKEKQNETNIKLIKEIILKPYYKKDSFTNDELFTKLEEFIKKIGDDVQTETYISNHSKIRNALFETQNSQFIIEEPEQNLFPKAQRDLVYYLLQKCLNRDGNRLTITTHSPYILYALNNCIMAGLVLDQMSESDQEKLKCRSAKVDPSFVSIYEIKDGCIKETIQRENGLIKDNYFDQQMKELMDDFYIMLNYYA